MASLPPCVQPQTGWQNAPPRAVAGRFCGVWPIAPCKVAVGVSCALRMLAIWNDLVLSWLESNRVSALSRIYPPLSLPPSCTFFVGRPERCPAAGIANCTRSDSPSSTSSAVTCVSGRTMDSCRAWCSGKLEARNVRTSRPLPYDSTTPGTSEGSFTGIVQRIQLAHHLTRITTHFMSGGGLPFLHHSLNNHSLQQPSNYCEALPHYTVKFESLQTQQFHL
eukprot:6460392-Amphidinium_carterae.1